MAAPSKPTHVYFLHDCNYCEQHDRGCRKPMRDESNKRARQQNKLVLKLATSYEYETPDDIDIPIIQNSSQHRLC